MRILFIAPYIPSLVRVHPYNFIRTMHVRGHEVTLLALVPSGESESSPGRTTKLVQGHSHRAHKSQSSADEWGTRLLSELPLQAYYSYSPAFAEKLQQVLSTNQRLMWRMSSICAAQFWQMP